MDKNKILTKSFGFEVKAVDDNGTFTGYGSVFGNVDLGGDLVAQGAFKRTINNRGDKVKLLWQHDMSQPIGVWKSLEEDTHGLLVTGQLNLDVQQGREAYALLKQGALDGLSIGFQTVDDSYDETSGVCTIKEVKLWEISLVTFPMNEAAEVTAVKSAFEELDQKQREETLKFINNLKTSPHTVADPLIEDQVQVEERHSDIEELDNKDSDPEKQELKDLLHSLEQLKKATNNK